MLERDDEIVVHDETNLTGHPCLGVLLLVILPVVMKHLDILPLLLLPMPLTGLSLLVLLVLPIRLVFGVVHTWNSFHLNGYHIQGNVAED
jgi:hypothetical protein